MGGRRSEGQQGPPKDVACKQIRGNSIALYLPGGRIEVRPACACARRQRMWFTGRSARCITTRVAGAKTHTPERPHFMPAIQAGHSSGGKVAGGLSSSPPASSRGGASVAADAGLLPAMLAADRWRTSRAALAASRLQSKRETSAAMTAACRAAAPAMPHHSPATPARSQNASSSIKGRPAA